MSSEQLAWKCALPRVNSQPAMSHKSKPKVLIIFGDAAETVDTLYPYFRLIEGGYEPIL